MRLSNFIAQSLLILFFVYAVCPVPTAANVETESIEVIVDRMLRQRDLGKVASELARTTPNETTTDLLIRLSIFGRAGHRSRVHSTLLQLVKAGDITTSPHSVFRLKVARRAIDQDDLIGRKLYYEKLALSGDEDVKSFVALWLKEGDTAELEKWLGARSDRGESWWRELLRLKQQLGTADEIYNELEKKIRENPADHSLVEKYLRAIASQAQCSMPPCTPSYTRDISWLIDVIPTDSAFAAYDLAITLRHREEKIAARLLEKSLSLPFGEKDRTLFGARAFRYASIHPVVKNPEKQLRYWTKKALAEIYLSTKQPFLAQPLNEELTSMDTSDIMADDVFRLAGQGQLASGQRVIESKILREEEQKEGSPTYWIDRASYYQGRDERALEWETYKNALLKFPCKPDDPDASQKRLHILGGMSRNASDQYDDEIDQTLKNEYEICAGGRSHLFEVSRLIALYRDELIDVIFVNNEFLPQILAASSKWYREKQYLIEEVMRREAWEPKQRDAVWNKLSELASKDISRNSAFFLAAAMMTENEYKRAVPLLEMCRRVAPEIYNDRANFTLNDVERELFDAYIEIGDWRKAERMFLDGFNYWGDELAKAAVAAAKSKNISDAVRLWKTHANLDRRKLAGIEELAKTDAKPALRDFYLTMKKQDPLSYLPEKALGYLN